MPGRVVRLRTRAVALSGELRQIPARLMPARPMNDRRTRETRGPRTTEPRTVLWQFTRRYPAHPAQPGAQQARDGGAAVEPRGWHRRERDVVQRHGRAAVQAAAGRDRIVTARVGPHQPVQRSLLRPDVLPRLPLDETGRAGVPVARRLRRFARDGGASRRPFAAGSRGVGVAGVLPGDRYGWRCQPARHWPGAARGHQRRVVEGTGRAGGSDRPATPDWERRTRDCVGRAIALRWPAAGADVRCVDSPVNGVCDDDPRRSPAVDCRASQGRRRSG